ncbi:hypothetical protein FBUS_04970, partial [Fasciolopsis buskii]
AQITCYECTDCPKPFSSTGTGVTSKNTCKYCKTENTYDQNGALTKADRTCVSTATACTDTLTGTTTGVSEVKCCRWNSCNKGSRLGPILSVASALLLGSVYTLV